MVSEGRNHVSTAAINLRYFTIQNQIIKQIIKTNNQIFKLAIMQAVQGWWTSAVNHF